MTKIEEWSAEKRQSILDVIAENEWSENNDRVLRMIGDRVHELYGALEAMTITDDVRSVAAIIHELHAIDVALEKYGTADQIM